MNSRTLLIASAAALVLAASVALAEDNAQSSGPMEMKSTGTPGKVAGSRSYKVTATVKALDMANREITLKGAKGTRPRTSRSDRRSAISTRCISATRWWSNTFRD